MTKHRSFAYQASCATCYLSSCESVMDITLTGKLLQCCIVNGMKLYWYALHDVLTLASRLIRILRVNRDLAKRYGGNAIWTLP